MKFYRVKACGKITYPTLNKAVESAIFQMKNSIDILHPYPCSRCKGFHLGHNKKWERRVRRRNSPANGAGNG